MVTIDTSTEFGRRVAQRLATEPVVWLTTAAKDGPPQPSPVWFLWDGSTFLIYSQPNRLKLRNIAARSEVALNFNATSSGGDVVIFTGTAEIAADAPPASEVPAYVEKYGDAIQGLGMDPAGFAASYNVPIRVTPSKLRGF